MIFFEKSEVLNTAKLHKFVDSENIGNIKGV